jgi:hypothetical protein
VLRPRDSAVQWCFQPALASRSPPAQIWYSVKTGHALKNAGFNPARRRPDPVQTTLNQRPSPPSSASSTWPGRLGSTFHKVIDVPKLRQQTFETAIIESSLAA